MRALPRELIAPGGLLLLGEVHGSKEIPRKVGELVALASERRPVVLALELPAGRTPYLQTFLRGPGGDAERRRLVDDPWWRDPFQDGRRSAAMVNLLDAVRALGAGGRSVTVVAIDTDDVRASQEDRESTLTANALAARRRHPTATMIVYAGSLHTGRNHLPFPPAFEWMAERLARARQRFVTLSAHWQEGAVWSCRSVVRSQCKVLMVPGSPQAAPEPEHGAPAALWRASTPGAFDGFFAVGALTPSPPAIDRYGADERAGLAVEAEVERQATAAMTAPDAWRSRARRAYTAGDYRACARYLARIAVPTGQEAYDHACCLARAERPVEALERLRYALDHGFVDQGYALGDPDLASLRTEPGWPFTPGALPVTTRR